MIRLFRAFPVLILALSFLSLAPPAVFADTPDDCQWAATAYSTTPLTATIEEMCVSAAYDYIDDASLIGPVTVHFYSGSDIDWTKDVSVPVAGQYSLSVTMTRQSQAGPITGTGTCCSVKVYGPDSGPTPAPTIPPTTPTPAPTAPPATQRPVVAPTPAPVVPKTPAPPKNTPAPPVATPAPTAVITPVPPVATFVPTPVATPEPKSEPSTTPSSGAVLRSASVSPPTTPPDVATVGPAAPASGSNGSDFGSFAGAALAALAAVLFVLLLVSRRRSTSDETAEIDGPQN